MNKEHICINTIEQRQIDDENINKLIERVRGIENYIGLLDDNKKIFYRVGLEWIEVDEYYLQVKPKVEDLDYLKMFVACLDSSVENHHIDKIYGIKLEEKPINIKTDDFDITPFIIIHFLKILDTIVKRGLKKDYIRLEENLQSKLKGKLNFSQNIKKNIAVNRYDRNYCLYQEYTTDCLENRILKKALLFSLSYINRFGIKANLIGFNIPFLLASFENISDDVDIRSIKTFHINQLYKDYKKGLELAKMILKRFSYSIKETNNPKTLYPFWIDMSKLFELYVFGLLKDRFPNQNDIAYEPKGKFGLKPDFVLKNEKMIIDTKYKEWYCKVENKDPNKTDSISEDEKKMLVKDIRQISGYARDKDILSLMGCDENTVVDCLIIYPNQDTLETLSNNLKETSIKGFTKFYKLPIKLPQITQ